MGGVWAAIGPRAEDPAGTSEPPGSWHAGTQVKSVFLVFNLSGAYAASPCVAIILGAQAGATPAAPN